jgi:hypothetical protein
VSSVAVDLLAWIVLVLSFVLLVSTLAFSGWLVVQACGVVRRLWVRYRPTFGDGSTSARWACLLCDRRVAVGSQSCWRCKLRQSAEAWGRA